MKYSLLLLAFLLLACNANDPLTCVELNENAILGLKTDPIPLAELPNWVTIHYDVPTDEVSLENDNAGRVWAGWKKREVFHQVIFKDEMPQYLTMTFTERPMSGQQVIDCLGEPDLYDLRIQRGIEPALAYSFLYGEAGIEVRGDEIIGDRDPGVLVTPELEFHMVAIREGGTFPVVQKWESWKPWGGWNAIRIDRVAQ